MNTQIREEAADWLVEFRTDTPEAAARERFSAWLRGSPQHVQAYLELVALWEDAGQYDAAKSLDLDGLIQLARTDDAVVDLASALPPKREGKTASPRGPTYRRRPTHLAIAATLTALAIGIGVWFVRGSETVYATEIGEQRSIRLSDGSSVELNALSRIRVRLSDHERAVDLLAGEALFRVAKDKARPFVVRSRGASVRAVGTQFDVHQRRDDTVVTVIEGRVAVLASNESGELSAGSAGTPAAAASPIELAAGEQTTVGRKVIAPPQRANVATATAWTQQLLIFDATPLTTVAEDFNRFNPRPIVIESPELADFHVSGTFSAVDPASLTHLLNFLRAQPGLQVIETQDRIVVTKK